MSPWRNNRSLLAHVWIVYNKRTYFNSHYTFIAWSDQNSHIYGFWVTRNIMNLSYLKHLSSVFFLSTEERNRQKTKFIRHPLTFMISNRYFRLQVAAKPSRSNIPLLSSFIRSAVHHQSQGDLSISILKRWVPQDEPRKFKPEPVWAMDWILFHFSPHWFVLHERENIGELKSMSDVPLSETPIPISLFGLKWEGNGKVRGRSFFPFLLGERGRRCLMDKVNKVLFVLFIFWLIPLIQLFLWSSWTKCSILTFATGTMTVINHVVDWTVQGLKQIVEADISVQILKEK